MNAALLGVVWATVPAAAHAQTGENVAIVINEASEVSVRVGEYYAKVRGLPVENVIRVRTSTDETIERGAYLRTIETAIAGKLAGGQLQDRVLYIVLSKGIPLRIAGTTGQEGTGSSVDSELTLLYRRLVGETVLTRGRVSNPYYLGDRDLATARPFTHREHDIYLVSRLDGFTEEDAIALIDRAGEPSSEGRVVLDQRGGLTNSLGDRWLAEASKRLSQAGHADRVLLEPTGTPVRAVTPVLGYYSWGSIDPQNRVRSYGMGFAPGAIAATFGSVDARTLREPPVSWLPTGNMANRATWFEGSPHSLIGDLVREGVTGVAGHVSEPYFQSVIRPEVLFSAYLAGHNLIESFYLAMPDLSWQAVVIGDPLCAPFPRMAPESASLVPALDAETDLPAFFAKRRMAQVAKVNRSLTPVAVAKWVRATGLRERGDIAGALAALAEAVELAPLEAGPGLDLGILLQQAGEVDKAIAQYERVVEMQPRNYIALNNLAYAMAVNRGQATEALTLARRAATLSPATGTVLDTLAWIEHLLGDDLTAAKRLAEAIRRDPEHPEIRLHAAIVYAALGARAQAETELKEALQLNPALAEDPQVKQLQLRLSSMNP
ncbi:MAG: TIGR03790 family protein [Acidobacteriota bacterium]